MRFYPRNRQSRADALGGPGHIGNHGPHGPKAELADRLKRYDPAIDLSTVLIIYGGSK